MMMEGLAGPAIFFGAIILMFLIVPFERIRNLALFGLIGGFGLALVLIYATQNLFGLWIFNSSDIVTLQGIPVLISAGWLPAVIIFAHLLSRQTDMISALIPLIIFPLAATLAHLFLLENAMLAYNNWNLLFTFLLSLIMHMALAGYLYATDRLPNLKDIVKP